MSPIAGIISENDSDVTPRVVSMLDMMQPDTSAVWAVIENHPKKSSRVARGRQVLAQLSLPLGVRSLEQPYFDVSDGAILIYEGGLYNSEELSNKLHMRHGLSKNSELVACLLKEQRGTLTTRIKSILDVLDGSYVLVVKELGEVVIARDPMGTRPVYLASDDGLLAFASNKKPLWQIGMGNVVPLRAGTMAVVDETGVKIDNAFPLVGEESEINDLSEAVECYQKLLVSSVEKRLADVNEVGVLLSGGVDSCLLAKLLADLGTDSGVNVVAYTVGVRGVEDVDNARSFAREIGVDCRVKELDISGVEEYIPRVIEAVEERDLVQVEAGVGIYAAMEMAGQDGIEVMFSGQGPDELWGGYEWYPKVLEKEDYSGLCRRMRDDLNRADIETLDRENKIAMAHGMEMRFPYVDPAVVDLAANVAPQLKVDSPDSMGKVVHRALARKIGLPEGYVCRPKSAAQHGTGVHDVLKQVAAHNGFGDELVTRLGYSGDKITLEKLGSSSRYGYKYADESMWRVSQPVQFFLDVVAYERGLLNEAERTRIERFVERLES
ncbi:MAG: asparagine synthetase B [Chloroflexi bacterium]|nr:asparagine synthetase B [Chloroflexota bacterium]